MPTFTIIPQVRPFLEGLRSYLNSRVPRYGDLIRESNRLSKKVEELLNCAFTDYQKKFLISLKLFIFTYIYI